MFSSLLIVIVKCFTNPMTLTAYSLLPESTSSTPTKSPLQAKNQHFYGEVTDKNTAPIAPKHAISSENFFSGEGAKPQAPSRCGGIPPDHIPPHAATLPLGSIRPSPGIPARFTPLQTDKRTDDCIHRTSRGNECCGVIVLISVVSW